MMLFGRSSRRRRRIFAKSGGTGTFVLLLLVLSGCAIHAPMSQTVMFHGEQETRPAHTAPMGIGATGTSSMSSTSYIEEEARQRFSESEVTEPIESGNIENRSIGGYISYYSDSGYALSLSLGRYIAGLDGTFRVRGGNYLTVSGSLLGGAQAFLQHRTYNSPWLGLSLGAGYRYKRQLFDVEYGDDQPSGLLPNYEAISVHSVGGRAVVVLRPRADMSGVVMGNLYLGYAPTYSQPIVTLGVAFGVF